MVKIIITKNKADEIIALEVDGHAGYADQGQDIVCAAASVLTLNTINSIAHLLKVKLEPESKSGVLKCDFPVQSDPDIQEKMQILLASMLIGIKAIKENYKEFINYKIKIV